MKKITVYEADDGTVFETPEGAQAHEKLIRLEKWYEEAPLYGRMEGSKVYWEDLLEWARDNRARFIELSRAIEIEGRSRKKSFTEGK